MGRLRCCVMLILSLVYVAVSLWDAYPVVFDLEGCLSIFGKGHTFYKTALKIVLVKQKAQISHAFKCLFNLLDQIGLLTSPVALRSLHLLLYIRYIHQRRFISGGLVFAALLCFKHIYLCVFGCVLSP